MTRLQDRLPAVAHLASLPLQVLAGETCCRTRQKLLQRTRRRLIDKLPFTWEEKELDVAKWQLDKAFACEWLDTERVLVATKCNQLLEVDLRTGRKVHIELPPEPPVRTHAMVDSGWGFCGIHAIDINPARDMLVTGGRNPTDAVVLRLPDYTPLQTLTGHLDWVFGAAWVSDRHLVTGSRDGAIALWDVRDGCDPPVQKKDFHSKKDMVRKFAGRVREIKYDFASGHVAALGTEGCIKLFDLERNFRITRTISLGHNKELVCMAQRADLLAAGSCGHVTLADPRQRNASVQVVQSPDGVQGVRSVVLHEHLLSFGTGKGKIVFVDMRTWQPQDPEAGLMLHHEGPYGDAAGPFAAAAAAARSGDAAAAAGPHPSPENPARKPNVLECGAGWLQHDELYWDHFAGQDIRNACYAHAWDPTGSRLFACGGPLAFGLKGCYMALWR